MPIRVAAAQVASAKGSYARAIDNAVNLIRRAAKLGAQIVCLPEHWLLEYGELAYDANETLAQAAGEEKIFIVTGANYAPKDNSDRSEKRIRSHLIGPDGQIVGQQDKVHLFRGEKRAATPGDDYEIIRTSLGTAGIVVCYDNVFPEACRTLALKGAEIVFVPSRIVLEGLDPWMLYLRTRAMENRLPLVAPNVFDPPHYVGGSVIIDLRKDQSTGVVVPRIVARADSGEKVIVASVDIEQARELRKERFADRRPKAYVGLL